MDVQQRLDEIVATVDGARSMPMSASCVVNRAQLLTMLKEVREALPGSLAQAQEVIGGRERVVAEAQEEARRIIESARAERGALISGTEVARHSQEAADRLLAEARREAAEIRAEADDYVDSKLANFEVVLSKTIGSVDRGREKLLGSGPGADRYGEQYAEDAPERTADPAELRQRADAYVDARLGSVSAVLAKTLEAVGRGRQKLLGHRPADDLGAHMAAQDGAQAQQRAHTSDADYLAGLAEPDMVPTVPAHGTVPPDEAAPYYAAAQVPAQPEGAPYPPPEPQPPHTRQSVPAAHDGYYGGPNAYHDVRHPAQYGASAPDYGAQHAGYAAQQPPPPNYAAPYYAQQPPPAPPEQPAALDETSLFDTSMIDLNQVRRYEEGYDQGR